MKNPKISIIVPTFNEEKTIPDFLVELKRAELKDYELIIVDDSTDNTPAIVKKLIKKLKIKGIVVKRYGKLGKGSAIRDGLKIAKGKYIVLIDADLQYPPGKIPKLVNMLKEYEIVNTRRLRKDPFYRKFLGYSFRFLVFLLFGLKEESQSTMRGFRNYVRKKVKFSANSWAWDVEFLYKAKRIGFKMTSMPIIYSERKSGKSKINLFTPLKMFLELLKIRLKLL